MEDNVTLNDNYEYNDDQNQQEEEKNKKKRLLLLLLLLLFFIILVLGGTGLYIKHKGNNDLNCDTDGDGKCDLYCDTDGDGKCDEKCNDPSIDIVEGEEYVLTLTDSAAYNKNNIVPGWTGSKSFKLVNTSNNP